MVFVRTVSLAVVLACAGVACSSMPSVSDTRPRAKSNTGSREVSIPQLPERRPRSWEKNSKSAATSKKTPPAVIKKVDAWSEVEVNIAHARCQHLLKQVDAVTIPQPAIKKGPCGDAAPVKLVSIGSSPQVAVSPPAIVNCQMVHALYNWLENDLQPLAKTHLGGKIITIESMSSYSCRNAYGRKSTRLSEHGRANALDIRGFVTSNGKRTRLLAHWGPTKRAIAWAKKKAQKKALLAAQKAAKQKATAAAKAKAALKVKSSRDLAATNTPVASGGERVPLPVRGTLMEGIGGLKAEVGTGSSSALGLGPSKLGGPKSKSKTTEANERPGKRGSRKNKKSAVVRAVDTPKVNLRVSNTRQAKFLRAAHVSACKIFGTVLGPEANNAHNNHFHVDLAPRKRSNYCE